MKSYKKIVLIGLMGICLQGCNKYLDIIPDNVPTVDYAFQLRTTAERYLFTCYSYIPALGNFYTNPANASGDEFWLIPTNSGNAWNIAKGNQNKTDSYANFWQGTRDGKDLFEGIRTCNIFLDNVDKVPELESAERERWRSEAKFLKAYFHYFLLRMYGPIPIIRENVPVDASESEVYPVREPIDTCVNYIVQLLDEATPGLPERINNEVNELGRITKAIAISMKAEVLMTAASPLFNGNPDYSGYTDPQGTLLFPATADKAKWERAAQACKEAIDFCESVGHQLYTFNPAFFSYNISDSTRIKMNIRNAICEKWNSEIIWGNTNSMAISIQGQAYPRGLDPRYVTNSNTSGNIAPPIKIAEMFYSNNGVPIDEDITYDYANRFQLKNVTSADRYYLQEGYVTAKLNFNREPRFYADLGFDGAIWYGQGFFDDSQSLLFVSSKKGQPASAQNQNSYSVSGYWPKKLVHFQSVIGQTSWTTENYPWPMIRLASLYLYYAEALNEASGPSDEVYEYVNRIRERAGLQTVQYAWSHYSSNAQKYLTQNGLREIIQRERLIEMAFEGQRYWDIRRWKLATTYFNQRITGWDLDQEDAALYYREKVIYNQKFTTRDYLWPIPESELLSNKRISQNPGW